MNTNEANQLVKGDRVQHSDGRTFIVRGLSKHQVTAVTPFIMSEQPAPTETLYVELESEAEPVIAFQQPHDMQDFSLNAP
jgi:hypothetical protein